MRNRNEKIEIEKDSKEQILKEVKYIKMKKEENVGNEKVQSKEKGKRIIIVDI